METFNFTIPLESVYDITEDIENRVFESGCDDALLGKQDGVVFLDFDREAVSLREAISSAIRDLREVGLILW